MSILVISFAGFGIRFKDARIADRVRFLVSPAAWFGGSSAVVPA